MRPFFFSELKPKQEAKGFLASSAKPSLRTYYCLGGPKNLEAKESSDLKNRKITGLTLCVTHLT